MNEFERRQSRVHRIDLAFKTLGLRRDDAQRSGAPSAIFRRAQIGAEVEEVVLNAAEHLVGRRIGVKPRDPDGRVGLVDGAVSGDTQRVLGHASAVAERGLAGIAATRIDPGQPHHGNPRG